MNQRVRLARLHRNQYSRSPNIMLEVATEIRLTIMSFVVVALVLTLVLN